MSADIWREAKTMYFNTYTFTLTLQLNTCLHLMILFSQCLPLPYCINGTHKLHVNAVERRLYLAANTFVGLCLISVWALLYDNLSNIQVKAFQFCFVLSLKRERLMYDWPHSRAVLWSNCKNKRAEIVAYNGTNTQRTLSASVRAIISQRLLLVAAYMKALWGRQEGW